MILDRLQRKCSCGGQAKAGGECAKCKKKHSSLQRKTVFANADPSLAPPIVHDVLRSPGQPLDAGTKAPMEKHFGHDFSNVRVHTDAEAAESARAVGARAYTVGRHVVFGEAPSRHLVAHELTHVVQQQGASAVGSKIEIGRTDDPAEARADAWAANVVSGGAPGASSPQDPGAEIPGILRRSVDPSSSCAANVHGAPADPLKTLGEMDEKARLAAFVGHHLLFIESATRNDPVFGPSSVSTAFLNWFGPPEETSPGTWSNRFNSNTFSSDVEAIADEMRVVSDRFGTLEAWFAGSVKYLCPATSSFKIPGCAKATCSKPAHTCPGSKTVAICPDFWTSPVPDEAKATLLVHEASHAEFKFKSHPTGTAKERGRNPYCYQGFLNEELNTGAQVPRNLCTALP